MEHHLYTNRYISIYFQFNIYIIFYFIHSLRYSIVQFKFITFQFININWCKGNISKSSFQLVQKYQCEFQCLSILLLLQLCIAQSHYNEMSSTLAPPAHCLRLAHNSCQCIPGCHQSLSFCHVMLGLP